MDQNLRTDWNVTTMDQNLRTDWNVTTMDQNLGTDWNVTTMDQNLKVFDWNIDDDFFATIPRPPEYPITLADQIRIVLKDIQMGYYPILAIVGVPVNLVTVVILIRKNCGLSKCVTHYLVAMALADLLVVILDLILRHIPIVFHEQFHFLKFIPVCNIHAILLYAATDCSVWFTVTFTFDRFVAISCQKLKSKYCSEKTASVVLGTVTVLSCIKNIFWYFMVSGQYVLINDPWFCHSTHAVLFSPAWGTIVFLHYILNPCVPFVLILLLNVLTTRHILVMSRARRRLRVHSSEQSPRDPEMESRRKSIILLFVISANFILLWSTLMVTTLDFQIWWLTFQSANLDAFVEELGYMLQLLSCCTNTATYAVTQTKFREHLKNMLKYPFTPILQLIK
ncbi:probable G-protein coupled receptor 139 [Scyliorhinus canicula]|uniref:probable G-protein coupled receptor 139 n=1 Tax=Scyliorhinus canicula TaxID=7830 RepID=UPI0018F30A0F|nr:probable G-protein coupled receptor 139 [Scyliorhinus canicula]XP_038630094.1 probable G-protein coupled receptor 139 [Scyliorhinus canicula]